MGKENARPDAKMRYVEEPGTFADLVVELGKPSATAGKFVLNLADEELKKNLTFPSFMHASNTTPLAKLSTCRLPLLSSDSSFQRRSLPTPRRRSQLC